MFSILYEQYSRDTKFLNIGTWRFTDGPPMNEFRSRHGCTTTIFGNSKVVIVVGGYDGNEYLNTMEMYHPLKNEWTLHSTRLPLPLAYLQVVHSISLNYVAYAIGGRGNGSDQNAIYGLSRIEEWELVGNLEQKRQKHASLNINSNDFPVCK